MAVRRVISTYRSQGQEAMAATASPTLDVIPRRRTSRRTAPHSRSPIALAGSWVQSVEADRSHLAHELHDEVGHRITTATLRIDRALERCLNESSRDELEAVRRLLCECADSVHEVAFRLRPRVLADLGLLAAVQGLARRSAAVSGIPVQVSARGDSSRIEPEIELAAFRIVQEALTNALKYAGATRIVIRIRQSPRMLVVVVNDNGSGFDLAGTHPDQRERRGLGGMEERAAVAGGRLVVDTSPGRGTIVQARFELGKAAS